MSELYARIYVLVAQSCLSLCDPMDCSPPGSSVHGILQAKDPGVGCHALLQIFLTQGSNLGLPHCRQNFYHLSYREVPEYKTCINPKPKHSI